MNKKFSLIFVLMLILMTVTSVNVIYAYSDDNAFRDQERVELNEESKMQGLNFEITGSTEDGVSDDFTKIAPGGYGFNFKVVNGLGEQVPLKHLNYKLIIDGKEYPKGVIAASGVNELQFHSFYGNITGQAKIEVCLKSDENIKTSYDFAIRNDAVNYYTRNTLYYFEDEEGIIPTKMKVQNFTYDIQNAKYIIRLPANPVSMREDKKFMGWSIKGVKYGAKARVIVNRNIKPFVVKPLIKNISGKWIKSSDGRWWYKNPDGTYPAKKWKKINGTWYHFDNSGYMETGWLKQGSTWYYLKSSGAMATGWGKVGKTWYYFTKSGAMKTGWFQIGSTWYYLKPSGAMATGWVKSGGVWYFMKNSGDMATGWVKSSGSWYLMSSKGTMRTGLHKYEGKWYYMNSSGRLISTSNGRVHGNANSKIYHLSGNRYYNKLSEKVLIMFNSEKDAISAGFRKSRI